MIEYTRSQIRDARIKWADFLLEKSRKKSTDALDKGDGFRCCLGHGAYILGVKRSKTLRPFSSGYTYGEDSCASIAPQEFIDIVGLWDEVGSSYSGAKLWVLLDDESENFETLASSNDYTNATPQQIGAYIYSVVEGGPDTPFRPLTDYPE